MVLLIVLCQWQNPEQSHRQSLENKSVEAAIKTESRGQNYALLISLLIITGALYLIDSGKDNKQ